MARCTTYWRCFTSSCVKCDVVVLVALVVGSFATSCTIHFLLCWPELTGGTRVGTWNEVRKQIVVFTVV